MKADMDILGFSNVSDSKWYIPIRRSTDQIAQAFSDVRRMVRDVASVYNFSFNKATVKHTEKAIEIIDINDLLDNHCGKVAMYAGLTQPLQAFDRVLNSVKTACIFSFVFCASRRKIYESCPLKEVLHGK